MNTTEISVSQIKTLCTEAGMAGDRLQVAICDIALGNEVNLDGIRGLGPTGLSADGSVIPVENLTEDQAIEACADAIAEGQG